MECLAARRVLATGEFVAVTVNELARELQELIVALDRRVPQLERADETVIARDGAALRALAVQRLRDLEECSRVAADQASGDVTPNRAAWP